MKFYFLFMSIFSMFFLIATLSDLLALLMFKLGIFKYNYFAEHLKMLYSDPRFNLGVMLLSSLAYLFLYRYSDYGGYFS